MSLTDQAIERTADRTIDEDAAIHRAPVAGEVEPARAAALLQVSTTERRLRGSSAEGGRIPAGLLPARPSTEE